MKLESLEIIDDIENYEMIILFIKIEEKNIE